MLPSKTSFKITSANIRPVQVLSLKLPEDMACRLQANHNGLSICLNSSNPSDNKLILPDGSVLPLTSAPETQIVDVARSSVRHRTVQIVGRVKGKLAVKQELAQEKASAIRLQSEMAEKERLSRKTVTIEAPSKFSSIKSTASSSVSSRARLMQRVSSQKKISTPRIAGKPKETGNDRLEQSSTQSWSPPIDVFSKPAEPSLPKLAPSAKKSKSTESVTEKAPVFVDHLEVQVQTQLKDKLKRYDELERWVNKRLEIFEQLERDLKTATGKAAATERITNKVAIETTNLKADKEYKWKLAEMEELRNELESLKSKLSSSSSTSSIR